MKPLNTLRGIALISEKADRPGYALILRLLRRPTRCHACGWYARFYNGRSYSVLGHSWVQAVFGRELHLVCHWAGGASVDTMLLDRHTPN